MLGIHQVVLDRDEVVVVVVAEHVHPASFEVPPEFVEALSHTLLPTGMCQRRNALGGTAFRASPPLCT